MQQGYFVTGTDTNAGKTWTTIALMRYFKTQGKRVIGMKPVASGCVWDHGKLKNEDALLIQANASREIDYDLINPYAYEPAVSPHLAGLENPVDLDKIKAGFNFLKPLADIIMVEGAGGWYAPLNECQDISDLAKLLALPVILVVAIKLGCINHAKLTSEAIAYKGLDCVGWIAVCSNPDMLKRDENIETLRRSLSVPLLGIMPYLETPDFDLLSKQLHL